MRQRRVSGQIHRVVFLDFDGVINVPYEYGTPEFEASMANNSYDFFRPEIVSRLDKLVHDYDLHVVISSSWRFSGIEFCQNSLRNAGFSEDVIVEGTTALNDDYPMRWMQILNYVETHTAVTEFVILDDLPMHLLSGYAVQTVFEDGYTADCDVRARMILDRQMQDIKEQNPLIWGALIVFVLILAVLLVLFLIKLF